MSSFSRFPIPVSTYPERAIQDTGPTDTLDSIVRPLDLALVPLEAIGRVADLAA